MKFITFRRYHGDGISGPVNIRYGTEVETQDGTPFGFRGDLIVHNGAAVAAPFSQIGITHFAVNDDGCGLQRGKLTYAIAHAPRRGDPKHNFRFSPEERDMLDREYDHWLISNYDPDGGRYINFNDAFYQAPVDDLMKLAWRLHILIR